MEKDFDFDNIGKRTPYCTPKGFFEESRQEIMERTFASQRRKRRLRLIIAGAIAAAVLAGLLFAPSFPFSDKATDDFSDRLAVETNVTSSDPMDQWIKELSDEELEELVLFSENDIFLNNN